MSSQYNDDNIYPVDIGTWVSYEPYSNQEQINEQLENLTSTGLFNGLGEIKYIYTKGIAQYNSYLEITSKEVKISDQETILEDEVYYTSVIEGAKTTRIRTSELHNGAPIKKDNEYSERMVKNGFDAVKLLNLYGNTIDVDSLHHVWQILTDGCRDNESVMAKRYRNDDVTAGGFVPANYKEVPQLMDIWIDLYNSSKYNDIPFIKASLLHYAFETIHPFCDGNGRMGRLLVNNYLIHQAIESARAVSFSMEINKKRILYDAAFTQSENSQNDCTPFISYFMEILSGAYNTALELQKKTKTLFG